MQIDEGNGEGPAFRDRGPYRLDRVLAVLEGGKIELGKIPVPHRFAK